MNDVVVLYISVIWSTCSLPWRLPPHIVPVIKYCSSAVDVLLLTIVKLSDNSRLSVVDSVCGAAD